MRVRVVEDLVFRHDGEPRILEAGTTLVLEEWTTAEQRTRARSLGHLLGFVPVTWLERRRWVPVVSVRSLDDEASRVLVAEVLACRAAAERHEREARQLALDELELRERIAAAPDFVERACARHRQRRRP